MNTVKYFIILGLILVIACQPAGYPVKTEMVGGIKTITSPEYPRDGRVKYEMEEELSIGVVEGDENYIFNNPRIVRVNDAGDIYVFDAGDTRIQVYDQDGQYLRTIGRQGQGPGEYGRLVYFDVNGAGDIFVNDPMNRRVTLFNKDGGYLQSFNLESFYSKMLVDNKNDIYFEKNMSDVEEVILSSEMTEFISYNEVLRVDHEGTIMCNYGRLIGKKEARKSTGPESQVIVTYEYSPAGVWNVDRLGQFYYGYNEEYMVSVYTPDGKPAYKFGRKSKPVKNPGYKGKPGQSEFVPVFNETFLFDESDNIWIELYRTDKEDDIRYDIFSPEGIYIKQIFVKYPILELKQDKAYCIVEIEDEIKVIKRFALVEK